MKVVLIYHLKNCIPLHFLGPFVIIITHNREIDREMFFKIVILKHTFNDLCQALVDSSIFRRTLQGYIKRSNWVVRQEEGEREREREKGGGREREREREIERERERERGGGKERDLIKVFELCFA